MEENKVILNELQHLGQMIQLLSYELTVIQDFMKDTYGEKFEVFHSKHSKDQRLIKGSRSSDGATRVEQKKPKDDGSSDSSVSDSDSDDNGDAKIQEQDEPAINSPGSGMDTGNISERDPLEIDDDPESSHSEILTGEGLTPKGQGRRMDDIWKKYIVKTLPDGKKHVKCPICLNDVSNKAERMRTHYAKCTFRNRPSASKSLGVTQEKYEVMKALRKEHKKGKVPKSPNESAGPGQRGKPQDPIWRYFSVEKSDGKVIATCINCGSKVSSKAERLRRHFLYCREIERIESKGSSKEKPSIKDDDDNF